MHWLLHNWYWIWGWIDPRANLVAVTKRKVLTLSGIKFLISSPYPSHWSNLNILTPQRADSLINNTAMLPTQMNYVFLMHVLDSFTYLAHIIDYFSLWHRISFCCDTLKQLSSWQTVKKHEFNYKNKVQFLKHIPNLLEAAKQK